MAQNVVRISCVQAFRDADFSALDGKATELKLSGFADDKNRGILELTCKSRAEEAGARIVPAGSGEMELEIGTMTAGNDAGRSSFPIISHSERVEGTADLQATIRNLKDGMVVSTQPLKGLAKYQQTTFLGIQGRGNYYVQNGKGKFEKVTDPSAYR